MGSARKPFTLQSPPDAIKSFNVSFCRLSSHTIRLSLAFSCSSSQSRCAWASPARLRSIRHLEYIVVVTLASMQLSAIVFPRATPSSIWRISSVLRSGLYLGCRAMIRSYDNSGYRRRWCGIIQSFLRIMLMTQDAGCIAIRANFASISGIKTYTIRRSMFSKCVEEEVRRYQVRNDAKRLRDNPVC